MMIRKAILLPLALTIAAFSHGAVAQQTTEQRLQHLERLMNSQTLQVMMERLNQQEREIQQLRGRIEEQEYTIENLRSRQRELYMDTDRRLSRIEREGGASLNGAPAQQWSGQAAARDPVAPEMDEATMQREREVYQQAFDLLSALRYEQATNAFRDFLKQFPDGRYAHIAQYWLGEAGYAQRKFEQAISDYQVLIDKYPNSPKRAEAMLKIGYSWNELKQTDRARKALQELVQSYPDSTEAGQARNLLGQMR